MSDGVMVTQRSLEALFMVRIHVGQPFWVVWRTCSIISYFKNFPYQFARSGDNLLNRIPKVSKCVNTPLQKKPLKLVSARFRQPTKVGRFNEAEFWRAFKPDATARDQRV